MKLFIILFLSILTIKYLVLYIVYMKKWHSAKKAIYSIIGTAQILAGTFGALILIRFNTDLLNNYKNYFFIAIIVVVFEFIVFIIEMNTLSNEKYKKHDIYLSVIHFITILSMSGFLYLEYYYEIKFRLSHSISTTFLILIIANLVRFSTDFMGYIDTETVNGSKGYRIINIASLLFLGCTYAIIIPLSIASKLDGVTVLSIASAAYYFYKPLSYCSEKKRRKNLRKNDYSISAMIHLALGLVWLFVMISIAIF
jgi:hypothetical protein